MRGTAWLPGKEPQQMCPVFWPFQPARHENREMKEAELACQMGAARGEPNRPEELCLCLCWRSDLNRFRGKLRSEMVPWHCGACYRCSCCFSLRASAFLLCLSISCYGADVVPQGDNSNLALTLWRVEDVCGGEAKPTTISQRAK